MEMLYNREKAVVFEWEYKRIVCLEVALPQVIRIVKHEVWQVLGFLIPKVLIPIVCEMFQERLQAGVLELCYRLYQNLWFLVKKKNKKYYVINVVIEYNKHTI